MPTRSHKVVKAISRAAEGVDVRLVQNIAGLLVLVSIIVLLIIRGGAGIG